MSGLHQAISTLIVHHDQQRQAMNAAQNIIHRVETWRASQEKFMHQLKNDFPLYADITGPFVSALAQVSSITEMVSLFSNQRRKG